MPDASCRRAARPVTRAGWRSTQSWCSPGFVASADAYSRVRPHLILVRVDRGIRASVTAGGPSRPPLQRRHHRSARRYARNGCSAQAPPSHCSTSDPRERIEGKPAWAASQLAAATGVYQRPKPNKATVFPICGSFDCRRQAQRGAPPLPSILGGCTGL